MGRMKDVLIGASERYAAEHGVSAEKVQDLILSGEVFGDKDLEWIADYAAGKEDKMPKIEIRRNPSDLQYVVARTKNEADRWANYLKAHIKDYGSAKVAYLYELSGIKRLPVDYEYGWTKEEDIHYIENSDGYHFNLPRPVKLGSSDEEKTNNITKIYLVLESDFSSPFPSLHDVYPSFDEALDSAYTKASVVHGTCQQHKGHRPLLLDYYNKGFKVIDEKDGTCHICYVEEREVELC